MRSTWRRVSCEKPFSRKSEKQQLRWSFHCCRKGKIRGERKCEKIYTKPHTYNRRRDSIHANIDNTKGKARKKRNIKEKWMRNKTEKGKWKCCFWLPMMFSVLNDDTKSKSTELQSMIWTSSTKILEKKVPFPLSLGTKKKWKIYEWKPWMLASHEHKSFLLSLFALTEVVWNNWHMWTFPTERARLDIRIIASLSIDWVTALSKKGRRRSFVSAYRWVRGIRKATLSVWWRMIQYSGGVWSKFSLFISTRSCG